MSLYVIVRNGCHARKPLCNLLSKNQKLNNFIRKDIKRWTTNIAEASEEKVPKVVGYWMASIAAGCFGAVSLGGVTRLTESGLSMVDWKLFGRPPPKNAEEWNIEFDKYKESPEFKIKNSEISMEDFKFIWYMEYGHRMWGRCIGAVYYIPAAIMWAKGYFTPALKKRVVFGGVLLACQGLMGWYMVKSGLDHKNFQGPGDVPRVSQYRLASHLSLAMILYSFMLWNSLNILKPATKFITENMPNNKMKALISVRKMAMGTKSLVFLTAISGAFVAGLDAGLVYNSFPLMADRFIPSDLFAYVPWLSNFTENPTTVQFDHRILGTTTLSAITYLAYKSRSAPLPPPARAAMLSLLGMGWMQVGLGISTLLLYVPVPVAALHQAGALITLSTALWFSHELKHVRTLSILYKRYKK